MRQLIAAFILFLIVTSSVSDSSQVKHTIYQIPEQTFSQQDVTCLAKNVYFEARGESFLGQRAIVKVTLNRWHHSNGMDICEVVYQHNGYGCQFSWTCDHKSDIPNKKSEAWQTALRAVWYVIKFGTCSCGVEHALYYHNLLVRPHWSLHMKILKRIGHHIFYAAK